MNTPQEQEIVSKVTRHFDSQINWLDKNFEDRTEQLGNKLSSEFALYAKQIEGKIADTVMRVGILERMKQSVQAETIITSVLISLVLVGLVGAAIL